MGSTAEDILALLMTLIDVIKISECRGSSDNSYPQQALRIVQRDAIQFINTT